LAFEKALQSASLFHHNLLLEKNGATDIPLPVDIARHEIVIIAGNRSTPKMPDNPKLWIRSRNA
jgi:hypothetical protein